MSDRSDQPGQAGHPTREQLESFLSGELPEGELGPFLAHLARECAGCLDRLAGLAAAAPLEGSTTPASAAPAVPPLKPPLDTEYDRAVGRAFAAALEGRRRIERERADVGRALAAMPAGRELDGLAPDDDRRLRGWALCEALLERSRALRHSDPRRMILLAQLARITAEGLEEGRYGREPVRDLQARSWAELANAHRVADDLAAAGEAMAVAARRCLEGSGDPLLLARVMDLAASLRTAERRFGEAFELLDGVHALYLSLGERHLAGRALISRGVYTGYVGEPEEAIALLERGLATIDPEREPLLVLSAIQGMAAFLVECGRFRQARVLVWKSGLSRLAGGDAVSRAKLLWLEGKIDAGLGRHERAEGAFRRVREVFGRARLGYKRALASLDLAAVWLRQGRTAEVRPLIRELIAAFTALGIGREAAAALRLLAEVTAQERLTLQLLEEVASFLRRLEHDPGLRFERPAVR